MIELQKFRIGLFWLAVSCVFFPASLLYGQLGLNEPKTVTLLNGTQIQGRYGSIPKMGATMAGASGDEKSYGIGLIDDDLRRVFVSRFNIANAVPLDRIEEHFDIWQKVDNEGSANSEIGPLLYIGPFNEYGRRVIRMQTARGPRTYIQGITVVTPRYCKVEGISEPGVNGPKWDMRIATSSVPTQVLVDVLYKQISDAENANDRLRLVEFFAQAGKYRQAEIELRKIRLDFPGLKPVTDEQAKLLRQRIARQALDEARLRQAAGQPFLALEIIKPLENSVGIATEILVEVNEVKKELETEFSKTQTAFHLVNQQVDKVLASPDIDGQLKTAVEQFREEIKNNLRSSNVDRLATFVRLADDPSQTDQQKLALAFSGWIIGAGAAIDNLGIAQSLGDARVLVYEYLQENTGHDRRLAIIELLKQMEGGSPEFIARILAQMTPPLAPSPNEIPVDSPMELTVTLPGPRAEQSKYLIQLPPEYDPYRRYPCIVTLGGETPNSTPEAQIRWWCGRYHSNLKLRMGQASRQGFIVIAPYWQKPGSLTYGYSARETAAVLASLRDAKRRFSINSDRVFLTGHFAGGDAAWDIGQAHPEHWAGVIPISARARKYVNHYQNNVKYHVPFYFVNGSRDFGSLDANSTVWNRQFISNDYDSMVVHFIGRGREKFSDEILNLIGWMRNLERRFDVRQFECSTMRPWDNSFWWLEVDLVGNKNMVYPEESWKKNRSDWIVSGEIRANRPNVFSVRGASGRSTLWLLPDLVDFTKDVKIIGASGSFSGSLQPSRKVILEDARTRVDRQHPYWGFIGKPDGKRWEAHPAD